MLSVNRELILLYWHIGREILSRQKQAGWGAKIIARLASDLHHAFPEMKGLSPRNLKYVRALAESYPDQEFVQQVVAQIPWGHRLVAFGTTGTDLGIVDASTLRMRQRLFCTTRLAPGDLKP